LGASELDDGVAEAGADVADVAGAEEGAADVAEVAGLDGADDEAAELHPATPAPATSAAAPATARRLANFAVLIMVNPISAAQAPQRAQCHGISPRIRPLRRRPVGHG
jgi:hypothetical protein